MDENLMDMKDAADLLDKVRVPLPEEVMTYYTLKNLPKEFDVTKQLILNERKLLSYKELEAWLLDEETSRNLDSYLEQDNESLLAFPSNTWRSYSNWGGTSRGYKSYHHHQGGWNNVHSDRFNRKNPAHSSPGNLHSRGYSSFSDRGPHTKDHRQNSNFWGIYQPHPSSNWLGLNMSTHNSFHLDYKRDNFEGELLDIIERVRTMESCLKRDEYQKKTSGGPYSQYQNKQGWRSMQLWTWSRTGRGINFKKVRGLLTQGKHTKLQLQPMVLRLGHLTPHIRGQDNLFVNKTKYGYSNHLRGRTRT